MRPRLILACTVLVLGACEKSVKTVPVSGTVTIGTAPLANGVIRFTPEAAPGVPATITEGKYSTQVAPGKYKVTVEAMQAPPTVPGEKVPPKELRAIPAKYKTGGVPTEIAGANAALDFDLSK